MRRLVHGRFLLLSALLLGLGFTALGSGAANAAGAANFFKGKTITYIVATKPGGGYDTYARLIGKYLGKYLDATVVVRNVPGAGHIIGANETYASKPDGLTIGTFNTGLIYAQLARDPGVKFNLRKFTWIGKAATATRVLVVSEKSPYKTFDDLRKARQVIMGTNGVGSANYNELLMMSRVFGIKMKIIAGYGGKDIELALERGEVQGTTHSLSSIEPFVKAGKARILLQIGIKKDPALPNVPLASQIAPPKGKALIEMLSTVAEISRLTAGPPGIPADRAQALIEAYRKALTDPGLLAEARKMGRPIDPAYGREVGDLIAQALNQPKENITLLRSIVKGKKKKKKK